MLERKILNIFVVRRISLWGGRGRGGGGIKDANTKEFNNNLIL